MPISATLVAPQRALSALAAVIAASKGPDTLAAVTVVVPTNACGVMTRRALGRSGGVVGVDMVTLNRLAELVAGPRLAAAGRSPMSTPVIDLTISSILADDPGPFGAVATHPSTVVALRETHAELRLADRDAVSALAAESLRGRNAVRVSDAITSALCAEWYDEADLFTIATALVSGLVPAGLRSVVLYLPDQLSGLARAFVKALGAAIELHIVAHLTGEADADAGTRALVEAIGPIFTHDDVSIDGGAAGDVSMSLGAVSPVAIVSTTDADEEVREATRLVLDAARAGTPFERIAVLWPTQRPYARLVEHHLTGAAIPWNGRSGTTLAERLAPRMVLDLLDVDRRGLRRRSVFDMLADLPLRDAAGDFLPRASWERVSREAGVARDDDWDRRLGSLANSSRWGPDAESLRSFITELRHDIGHPSATKPWADWSSWCTTQIDQRLGARTIDGLSDIEYRAYEALTETLDRLAHLDPVSEPVTRQRFRTTLEAELDAAPARQGRVGHGVTVAPLAGAIGIDVDVAIVLGAADGLLPPRPSSDPLLSETDRVLAGLSTIDDYAVRLHRILLAAFATSRVTLTVPRGDLRASSTVQLSRWLEAWSGDQRVIASHHAGLAATTFPTSAHEHRLRGRALGGVSTHTAVHSGLHSDATNGADDRVFSRGLRLLDARNDDSLTEFDGDLSAADAPLLDTAVSPSRLEAWSACPHAYFDHYLLEATPVEEPGGEISITARDRGTAHHVALDLFHQSVVDGELPQPGASGWTNDHRSALTARFHEVCDRTERRGRAGRPASWADERSRMLADLLGWLDRDGELVVQRGSVVLASEMRFGTDDHVAIGLPDGRQIALRGTIDRVDQMRNGSLVVTDHKSGGKRTFKDLSSEQPTAGGTLFQLPSYAAAARARFGRPDTPVLAEYGLLRKGDYDRPGIMMTPDVDAAVSESLAHVIAGIEAGYFPNVPDRPGWRLFVPCWYCEPDGLGTAEQWAHWRRKRHDVRLAPWFAPPELDEADPTPSAADAP